MRLSLCTDCLGHLPFERMLDEVVGMGVEGVEMTVGGWSPAPHLRADELLADAGKRRADTEKTIALAGHLGVEKIVMMSGLPPAAPGDRVPNWITYTVSWPPTLKDRLDHQWNEVAIPYWRQLVAKAEEHGVEGGSRSRTSARCWCGTRRPCSGCATRWARWSASTSTPAT